MDKIEQNFESDIEKIGSEVKEKVSRIEVASDEANHKEIIREVTHPIIHGVPSQQIVAKHNGDEGIGALPAYTKEFPTDVRQHAEALVSYAFEKGIFQAAEEARRNSEPAVMDAFHDAITTTLYEEFKKRGIL